MVPVLVAWSYKAPSHVDYRVFEWSTLNWAHGPISCRRMSSWSMSGKNRRLVKRWTDWVWEITSWSWRLQRITDHFRGICRIYLTWIKQNRKMSTCNRLDFRITRILTDYARKLPWALFLVPHLTHILLIYGCPDYCCVWCTHVYLSASVPT